MKVKYTSPAVIPSNLDINIDTTYDLIINDDKYIVNNIEFTKERFEQLFTVISDKDKNEVEVEENINANQSVEEIQTIELPIKTKSPKSDKIIM